MTADTEEAVTALANLEFLPAHAAFQTLAADLNQAGTVIPGGERANNQVRSASDAVHWLHYSVQQVQTRDELGKKGQEAIHKLGLHDKTHADETALYVDAVMNDARSEGRLAAVDSGRHLSGQAVVQKVGEMFDGTGAFGHPSTRPGLDAAREGSLAKPPVTPTQRPSLEVIQGGTTGKSQTRQKGDGNGRQGDGSRPGHRPPDRGGGSHIKE